MQRTRHFTWALNKEMGQFGWLVDPAPAGWYAGPGFLAAHDTMEHLSDKPDWAHELRATGVAVFGLPGATEHSSRTYSTIAEAVVTFAAFDHAFEVPEAPPLAHKRLAEEHEKRLAKMVLALSAKVRELRWDNPRVMAEGRSRAVDFPRRALPWLRLGYRAAMRVYGDGEAMGTALFALRDALNIDHDAKPPIKGDRLTVSVDCKTLQFTAKRSGNEDQGYAARRVESFTEALEAELA